MVETTIVLFLIDQHASLLTRVAIDCKIVKYLLLWAYLCGGKSNINIGTEILFYNFCIY